jgi:hypothetical protein
MPNGFHLAKVAKGPFAMGLENWEVGQRSSRIAWAKKGRPESTQVSIFRAKLENQAFPADEEW